MTQNEAIEKLLKTAIAEEGYLEKATSLQLDDKTANAGNNNYTKYARDHAQWGTYQASKQGLPWCDQFVDWCFIKAFGFDIGMKLTCQSKGGYGAGCTESYNYYKQKGQTVSINKAQPGDQIFFGNSKTMTHTGIVTKVENGYVYTIEGNTSSGDNKVIANGGGVFQKKYTTGYANIKGIGRPNWSIIANEQKGTQFTQYKESAYLGGVYMEIPFSQIAHIEHVKMNANNGETIDSIYSRVKWKEKAPSIIINAELYNLKDMSPASGVKHSGVVERVGWQPGIGFKDSKTPIWLPYNNITTNDWLGGYPAVIQGGVKKFDVPAGLGGNTYRTMVGIKDGVLGIICTKSGCSIDTVATKMLDDGYQNVINLDGGASTCYVTPKTKWSRNKRLRGYIAVWLNGVNNSTTVGNPIKDSAIMLQDKKYASGKTYIVTASALNIRAQDGSIITTVRNGAKCQWYGYYTTTLPGMSGKFLWVIVNGKTGFASANYLK